MALGDHATYFRMQNFKGFEDLEVHNLGWVNLIVGDNNVGKTSLLEALHFHADARTGMDAFRQRLIEILKSVRGIEDFRSLFLDFFVSRASPSADIPGMEFTMKYRAQSDAHFSLHYNGREIEKQTLTIGGKTELDWTLSQGSRLAMRDVNNRHHISLPYIPVNRGYGPDLVSNYSTYIQKYPQLKRQLLEDLRLLVPQLESFEPSEETIPATIILFLKDLEGSVALPMMGEGAIKLFRILSEILVWKGQRLMIDEIDTGFHHSKMRPFWKTILASARTHETQLFATTHNLECIQHLKYALEADMPDFQEEVRVIRLARVKAGIKAYTYTYPEFEAAIDNENELR